MMHSLSVPPPNRISPDAVWETLQATDQQHTLEFLGQLAIKLIAQHVADDDRKERYYGEHHTP